MDSKKRNTVIEIVKFLGIGLLNTLLTYLIYSLLIFLSFNHFIALFIEYLFGIFFGFFLNKIITFKDRQKKYAYKLFKMTLVYIAVLFFNAVILYLLVDYKLLSGFISFAKLDDIICKYFNKDKFVEYSGQFIALCIVVPCSFIFQKFIVFNKKQRN